jgi:hypothetical protein
MNPDMGSSGNGENPDDAFKKVHDNAEELIRIHKQMEEGEINITETISRYERRYGRDGVLMLLEDLQRMHFLYKNLLEDIKKADPLVFAEPRSINTPTEQQLADAIRNKYIKTGLLPREHMPSTTLPDLAKTAFRFMRGLGKGTWHVTKTHARELFYALRLDPDTTVTFQISIGTDLGVTFGWERTIKEQ